MTKMVNGAFSLKDLPDFLTTLAYTHLVRLCHLTYRHSVFPFIVKAELCTCQYGWHEYRDLRTTQLTEESLLK